MYVYHRDALARLLASHADVLAAAEMPVEPERFIAHIAANWIETSHPAYHVIANAFGDTT